jgi:glutamate/tyrosine decarboxylase-like PLP-dependent enzyme
VLTTAPNPGTLTTEESLDPKDWEGLRRLGHRMVDDVLDYLRTVRERPTWQTPSETARQRVVHEPLPLEAQGPESAYRDFVENVLPYPTGNVHPRFWGWVMGTGTPFTALAEMLAATMNPNVGGFDDGASLVEDRVLDWFKELMGFPREASGLLLSGASMANLVGLAAARHARASFDVRRLGQAAAPRPMTLYASLEVHNSVGRAVELLGLGLESLRLVPVDAEYRMDVAALEAAILADRRDGRLPFAVVGSAGTVNTGAIDDLPALAALARREALHFHVDGAIGALAALSPELRGRLRGMELADSIAFDAHKWGHFPYEAGCVLVRDPERLRGAFAATAAYLARAEGGITARGERFADRGPQLSRGFRALKLWMGLKAEGTLRMGRAIRQNVEQARYLAERVQERPELELLAPAPLNIVCFRYRGTRPGLDLDGLNRALLVEIQESGVAVPSATTLGGRYALRVCITNHRTRRSDLDFFLAETLRRGQAREDQHVAR